MFKIGTEVFIKYSNGLKGIIINSIKKNLYNDYLVKTELFEKWYHENELQLASTISKIEMPEPKFKSEDEVIFQGNKFKIKSLFAIVCGAYHYVLYKNEIPMNFTVPEYELQKVTKEKENISIKETTKYKFNIGDEVSFGELYHHVGKTTKVSNNGFENIYIILSVTGEEWKISEDKIKFITNTADYRMKSDKENYWETINKMAEKQRNKGISKYGYTLEQNQELDTLESIIYLQEELIDALMYCEHLKSKVRKLKEI